METRKNHNKSRCVFGFTMIEMIIALSLFAVVVISAYGAFRGGFVAYQRIESQLGSRHELSMLTAQLGKELRAAIFYAPVPFEGKSDKLEFPARLWRYDRDQLTEDLYQVSYQCRDGQIVRTEQKIRKKFSDSGNPESEPLLPLSACKFQFAYKMHDGNLIWKNELSDKPYQGIPRAIRFAIKGKVTNNTEETLDFLIPQGILTQLLGSS